MSWKTFSSFFYFLNLIKYTKLCYSVIFKVFLPQQIILHNSEELKEVKLSGMLDQSCFVGLPLLFLNAKLMICQSGQVCDPFLLVWHAEQHPCLSQPCADAHPLVPAMLPLLLHPPYYHTP